MSDAPDRLPELDADITFEAPWQARAFGLAVAFTDAAGLDWEAFQSRLVDEVGADRAEGEPEAVYYRQWLAALESLLVEEGHFDEGELADRVTEFAAGDRTAHEFVEGDPHGHADALPEGHAEGSHGHHHDHGHGQGHDHHGHGHGHGHDHDHPH